MAVIGPDLLIEKLNAGPAGIDGPALLLQSSGTTELPKIVRRDAKMVLSEWEKLAHYWLVEQWAIEPCGGLRRR